MWGWYALNLLGFVIEIFMPIRYSMKFPKEPNESSLVSWGRKDPSNKCTHNLNELEKDSRW